MNTGATADDEAGAACSTFRVSPPVFGVAAAVSVRFVTLGAPDTEA